MLNLSKSPIHQGNGWEKRDSLFGRSFSQDCELRPALECETVPDPQGLQGPQPIERGGRTILPIGQNTLGFPRSHGMVDFPPP